YVQETFKMTFHFSSGTTVVWAANVSAKITALTRSCVVVPCHFQAEGDFPVTRLRGMWVTTRGGFVYHNGQTRVLDNFKGRTKMLGNLVEQNCTLEINDIKAHDNGPFCFEAEKEGNTYLFNNSCVFIVMKASPKKPVMTPLPHEVDEGTPVEATCSVTHTCPTHPPWFAWNVREAQSVAHHTERGDGVWETSSTLTFTPYGSNFEDVLTCNVTFWGGKTEQMSRSLNVKRRYSHLPVVLPASCSVFIFFVLLVTFIIWKRGFCRIRKEEQPERPPRPGRRRSGGHAARWLNDGSSEYKRSIWSRFSRRPQEHVNTAGAYSGYQDHLQGKPPRPEKRRSIWSRLSRRRENNEVMNVAYSKPPANRPHAVRCGRVTLRSDEGLYENISTA
ncbi:myelin-associated glycoprotein-like, partial [Arapaima gigas]